MGDRSPEGLQKREKKDQFTAAFSSLVNPVFPKITVNSIIFKNHQVELKA
jgi:hypothetical protein